jgi:hypothetical protein
MGERGGTLIALGEGVYTVPEIARILQPNMTEYKVRRWLHKDLLGEPIAPFLKDGTQKCASDASAALEVVPTPTASLSDSTGE